jgi:hypothetical protein
MERGEVDCITFFGSLTYSRAAAGTTPTSLLKVGRFSLPTILFLAMSTIASRYEILLNALRQLLPTVA